MSRSLDRREFSVAAALALLLLGGATITIGCGGGSSNPTSPTSTPTPTPAPAPSPSGGNIAGVVAANHAAPHLAVITAAQLTAGIGLSLDIRGEAFHSHTLTLTGAQVTQIAAAARVSEVSSRDNHSDGSGPHSHTVTFN
jgi:hypothetical protein